MPFMVPARGEPSPSVGFHQGTVPCSQSPAARCEKACDVNPVLGSMVSNPGNKPSCWPDANPENTLMGFGSKTPTR
jgi:hypothetical protein